MNAPAKLEIDRENELLRAKLTALRNFQEPPFKLSEATRAILLTEADRRGVNVAKLAMNIIENVANDSLFTAVLDD